MANESAPLLEGRGLSKTHRNGKTRVEALKDVSFVLEEGGSLGVVGESGAGKSTLLSLLLGLEKPDAGELIFRGERFDLGDRDFLKRFRKRVQVVFQDPRSSLDPRMRIEAIVGEPLRELGIPGDRRERVREVLDAVGLGDYALGRYPHEFSGGQRQRIAIARALAPAPDLLAADEPVSALDVTVRLQILDLLASLKERYGLALVLVSHDLGVVARLCRDTLVLRNGSLEEAGRTRDLFAAPRSAYTRELLSAVPRLAGATAHGKA